MPKYLLSAGSIRTLMASMHPAVSNPTIEHCVPKCHYRGTVDGQVMERDMHALICLPAKLNSARSNYKLCDPCSTNGWSKIAGGAAYRHEKRRLFFPPAAYRGAYARSIGYFVLTYPSYAHVVHSQVLDLDLLVEWSQNHPCNHMEIVKHETIASIQHNENPFVTDPASAERLVLDFFEWKLHEKNDQEPHDGD